MAACQEQKSAAALRNAVFHQPYRLIGNVIPGGFKALKESSEWLRLVVRILESGYILDEHNVRFAGGNDFGKTGKKRHAGVFFLSRLLGVLFRERLTGRAPAEKDPVRSLIGDERAEASDRNFADIRKLEASGRKVEPEGLLRIRIPIKAEYDFHPGFTETATRSATPGKKVEYFDLHGLTLLNHCLRQENGISLPQAARDRAFHTPIPLTRSSRSSSTRRYSLGRVPCSARVSCSRRRCSLQGV